MPLVVLVVEVEVEVGGGALTGCEEAIVLFRLGACVEMCRRCAYSVRDWGGGIALVVWEGCEV